MFLTRFSKSGRLLIPRLLLPHARRFLGVLVSPGLLAIAMRVCGRRLGLPSMGLRSSSRRGRSPTCIAICCRC